MLPKTPIEWTLGCIESLVRSGYQESESCDFKRQLPESRSEDQKSSLAEDCCAFANSNGGFLVFGIEDAQKVSGKDRIVGIDTPDFQAKFGNYPSRCEPSVDWQFRETPIELGNGRVLQVVHIAQSFRGPHAVHRDDRWVFKKRTNKGNENMSYDEIRRAFLHNHERLRRASLLRTELDEIMYEASQYLEIIEGKNTNFPARFDLSVLDALWSDIYPVAHASTVVAEAITRLRRLCRTVNRNADIIERWSFRGTGAVMYMNPARTSNSESLHGIIASATDALKALQDLLP